MKTQKTIFGFLWFFVTFHAKDTTADENSIYIQVKKE
jgi:hypothetical protein